VINEDAFLFLQRDHPAYGVIIVDLPDPRTDSLAKLYSVEGYRLFRRHLAPGGIFVTQATSPYFATQTYWSVAATLREAGLQVVSYHTLVPSFGDWGFHLAADREDLALRFDSADLSVARRFLRKEQLPHMRIFSADTAPVAVESNRLDRPIIIKYYAQDWDRW
jgi:spermidine synthase